MTDTEAIEAVKAGKRCETRSTIHGLTEPKRDGVCVHSWRTVACDDDTDVIECMKCGDQRTTACTFDDDFA